MLAKRASDDKDQARRFRKAARELGCDENEDRFKSALRTVGKAKPADRGKGQAKKTHK